LPLCDWKNSLFSYKLIISAEHSGIHGLGSFGGS